MKDDLTHKPSVAYFSMEIGIISEMPTYSGGLGVLAGDSLRAAAELGIPMIGITLLHRKGYFRQHLDAQGNQSESPVNWNPQDFLEQLTTQVTIIIEGRQVLVGAWCYRIPSSSGSEVLIYFLDTTQPENSSFDQTITDYLYGGDDHYRLCQETILGFGGIAMLRALGYMDIEAYHMNEGHAALLALALIAEETKHYGRESPNEKIVENVREKCVFTTHTPVPVGMDKFPLQLVKQVLGEKSTADLVPLNCLSDDNLNMNLLALCISRYINGVSMRNEEISRDMFPKFPINSITNGVHAVNWTSEPFQRLYDKHIPEWRNDNWYLRYAINISLEEIHQAHTEAKQNFINEIKKRNNINLNPTTLTLGFGRRMTGYKRPEFLFSDLERLKKIAREVGPLQVIYSGKAHPKDYGGKLLIRKIFEAAEALKNVINVTYLEDYDINVARLMCSGVDLWLNTPHKPYEASGTSGMKAALNGIPSFSIADGWWVEGHVEGVTGWSIGDSDQTSNPSEEIASMYEKLENTIVPMFYRYPISFDSVMRYAIALNGSYYHAQRMMFQYLEHAYMSRK